MKDLEKAWGPTLKTAINYEVTGKTLSSFIEPYIHRAATLAGVRTGYPVTTELEGESYYLGDSDMGLVFEWVSGGKLQIRILGDKNQVLAKVEKPLDKLLDTIPELVSTWVSNLIAEAVQKNGKSSNK